MGKILLDITRGQNDRLVTAKVRLRRQHVHFLRAGRARNEFHADGADTALGEFLDQLLFVERIQQARVNRALLEPRNFLRRWLAQAQYNITGADERLAVAGHHRTGFGVGIVGKSGGGAEAGLNFHLRAKFDQLGGAVRRQWCPGFARMRFFRH